MGVHYRDNEEKLTIGMIIAGIIIIGILLTSLILYLLNINSTKVNEEYYIGKESVTANQNGTEKIKDVTSEIGNTVNEARENLNTNNTNKMSTNTTNDVDTMDNNSNIKNEDTTNTANAQNEDMTKTNKKIEKKENVDTAVKNSKEEKIETKTENKNDIKFISPIKGEIIREFAPDSLVYSETLKEWITHNGIDIKADKATDVSASYDGKVSSIKNDPRYGLTIIIDHTDGYRTIYANLLSADNVVEGEEVKTGQTIGTVGNSANFEIADDYHLHFEILKDGDYVNPLTQFTDK